MIEGSDLLARFERYVNLKPGRAARMLTDLDKRLEKTDDEYDRNRRDALLQAFERTGRCSHCGRSISNSVSVEKGMGQVCRKRVAEAERRREARAA